MQGFNNMLGFCSGVAVIQPVQDHGNQLRSISIASVLSRGFGSYGQQKLEIKPYPALVCSHAPPTGHQMFEQMVTKPVTDRRHPIVADHVHNTTAVSTASPQVRCHIHVMAVSCTWVAAQCTL